MVELDPIFSLKVGDIAHQGGEFPLLHLLLQLVQTFLVAFNSNEVSADSLALDVHPKYHSRADTEFLFAVKADRLGVDDVPEDLAKRSGSKAVVGEEVRDSKYAKYNGCCCGKFESFSVHNHSPYRRRAFRRRRASFCPRGQHFNGVGMIVLPLGKIGTRLLRADDFSQGFIKPLIIILPVHNELPLDRFV